MTRIRLLTFDLDDTLWPVEPLMQQANAALYQWLSREVPCFAARFPPEELARFARERARQRPDLEGFVTRKRMDLLRAVLAACDLEEKRQEPVARQAFGVFLAARQQVRLFPGVTETLAALSRDYILCAVSNGNADIRQTPAGPFFSAALSAESCGHPKPDPRIFHAALARCGCAPAETLHVGDHPATDVHAAREAGLHAVWVHREHDETWPADLPIPEHEIKDLGELPALLERIHGKIH